MSHDSNHRPISAAAARIVDQICDLFERAWQKGEPALEEYLASAPPEERRHLLPELVAIEVHYRRNAEGGEVSLAELAALHPTIADDLRACAAALSDGPTQRRGGNGAPRLSDVALASVRQPQGLHIRCPHCASPVELLADTPDEDVTCRACGSTFCLVDRGEAGQTAPSLRSVGRFELISRLGVGGFGTVWKARDPELDRTVALKIPRKGQLRTEEIDFFFREARAAAQLRHPHIVAVYEIGREADTVFIVSDFVHGVTLSEWLSEQKPTVREAAELCAQVADALDHAHEHGVVHRDLKPSNIMIDDAGQPRIMDFGLAKRESGEITMTCDGQILGTAAYMSPEQAAGKGHWIDRRADVYSLGVVMFQMATGELPFRGSMEVQLTNKLLDDAPDPRKLNKYVPRDFATICLKCLERSPTGRYARARDVAAELRRFLQGEPIDARPVSRFERAWRWTKRKPALAAAAALAAVVMVAGPVAAVVINGQRRELDGRVKELDKLVTSQQVKTQLLRSENAALHQSLASESKKQLTIRPEVLEWRRNLIADVVDRHYDATVAALDDQALDAEAKTQIQLALGMMLTELGRADAAIAQLFGAQAELEELAKVHPDDARVRAALADCCEQLAELYQAAKHVEAAQRSAARALEIRRELAESQPGAAARIDVLASQLANLDGAAALQAIPELAQRVVDEWPRDPAGIYEAACRLTGRSPVMAAPTAASDADATSPR